MPTTRFASFLLAATLSAAPAAPPKPAPGASDASIEQSIKARFAKSKIGAEGFTVKVQRGAAILEGTTNVIQRKGAATRLAKLGGASSVDNRIRIGEAARQKAAANLKEHRPQPSSQVVAKPAAASPPVAPVAVPRAIVKH